MRASQSERRAGSRSRTLCSLGVAICMAQQAGAATDKSDPIEFYVTDQLSYDDNLFRVPDGLLASDPSPVTVQSLDDYLNRASAGVHTRWETGRQVIGLHLRVDDVRLQNNDNLNYVGGNGSFNWDWQLGKRWSGVLNTQYDRSLASYTNYRFFRQDLIDIFAYGAEARLRVGSRWTLLGAGNDLTTDHSADERRAENFHVQSGRSALEYRTPSDDVFALEYRFTDADFPIIDRIPGAISQRYREQVPGVRVDYRFTDKTRIQARYGHLERDYASVTAGSFSGGIWNFALHWEPSEKTAVDFNAWHEVKAYADAESQYFVARGGSFGPTWTPTSKLAFSVLISLEDQDYVAGGGLFPDPAPPRRDRVQGAQFGADYSPNRRLGFKLLYRWADYSSNRPLLDYRDNAVSLLLRIST